MSPALQHYVLLFFTCAVFGWVMEVVCKLIQFHRFINRGFLIGPWCPIYGFGAVLITLCLSRFEAYPAAVFALALLLCGTLEYLTSYVMEKLFHARWWDYSQKPFNLNGRVCAGTLIPFGLLGLLLIYGVRPLLFGLFDRLSPGVSLGLCIGLTVLFLSDSVISVFVLGKIRKTAELQTGDNTEALTRLVREKLMRDSALLRRTLRAFPYARLYNRRLLADVKAARRRVKENVKAAGAQMRKEMESREQKLREELRARRRKG